MEAFRGWTPSIERDRLIHLPFVNTDSMATPVRVPAILNCLVLEPSEGAPGALVAVGAVDEDECHRSHGGGGYTGVKAVLEEVYRPQAPSSAGMRRAVRVRGDLPCLPGLRITGISASEQALSRDRLAHHGDTADRERVHGATGHLDPLGFEKATPRMALAPRACARPIIPSIPASSGMLRVASRAPGSRNRESTGIRRGSPSSRRGTRTETIWIPCPRPSNIAGLQWHHDQQDVLCQLSGRSGAMGWSERCMAFGILRLAVGG